MPQKKHKPEEIVAKLRQVDVLVSQGRSVAEALRSICVTQFTYYRWRKAFGGLAALSAGTNATRWATQACQVVYALITAPGGPACPDRPASDGRQTRRPEGVVSTVTGTP